MTKQNKLPETPDQEIERLKRERDQYRRIVEEITNESISFTHSAKGSLPQITTFLEKVSGPLVRVAVEALYLEKLKEIEEELLELSLIEPEDDEEASDLAQTELSSENQKRFIESRLKSIELLKDSPFIELLDYDHHIRELVTGSSRDMARFIERSGGEIFPELSNYLGIRTLKNLISQVSGHVSYLKSLEDGAISWLDKAESFRESNYSLTEGLKEEPDEIHILELLDRVQESLRGRIKNKRLNLINKYSGKDHIKVLGKRVILENEVFKNLYYNATKFSYEGSNVETSIKKLDGQRLEVEIKDYGSGIPEEVQKNIFSKKEKTTTLGTSGEMGTGHGLPYAKNHLKKWNGDIYFETKTGEGSYTSFKVILPLCEESQLVEFSEFGELDDFDLTDEIDDPGDDQVA